MPETIHGGIAPAAEALSMQVMAYGPDNLVEKAVQDFGVLESLIGKHPVLWGNVEGPVSMEALEKFGALFKLHPLALEDVANRHQRAKVEDYTTHHFVVTHMIGLAESGKVQTEQLSLFVSKDFVITFQDNVQGDCLDSVREGIRRA